MGAGLLVVARDEGGPLQLQTWFDGQWTPPPAAPEELTEIVPLDNGWVLATGPDTTSRAFPLTVKPGQGRPAWIGFRHEDWSTHVVYIPFDVENPKYDQLMRLPGESRIGLVARLAILDDNTLLVKYWRDGVPLITFVPLR